jgi:hypothetical protein
MDPVGNHFAPPGKDDLSVARQRLVELMQEVNFGRIEHLRIVGGEPQHQPKPRLLRIVALQKESGPRPERSRSDFALKGMLRELFRHLDTLHRPSVVSITVQHGLPVRLTIEEVPEA